jgi:hypothetical protein
MKITEFIGGGFKEMLGTQAEFTLAQLKKAQDAHKPNPNCPHCEGSGTIWEANGADDVEPSPCPCVVNSYK